jgi:hypothetical protein
MLNAVVCGVVHIVFVTMHLFKHSECSMHISCQNPTMQALHGDRMSHVQCAHCATQHVLLYDINIIQHMLAEPSQ